MKLLTKRTVAAVAACLLVAATVGCGIVPTAASEEALATPQAEGILVTGTAPTRGDMLLETAFVGSVQPEQVVSVMPKTMGIVKQVHVAVGQTVKKGDLLLTLDDTDLQPGLKQAEAGYNSAAAQVQQMTGSTYKSQLSGLDTQFDQSFDNYESAKDSLAELESTKAALPGMIEGVKEQMTTETDPAKLLELGVKLSKLQEQLATIDMTIEKAEVGVDMSRKYFNNARSSYNAMKVEGQEEMQTVADATLAQAQASLNLARQQLEFTKLYAPIDGVVESVSATALNPVSNSAPAFVISNKTALAASFNVPSASIGAMEIGGKVTVQKGAKDYPGTITEVNTMINQQTGLFTVKASIDTPDAPELLTGVMVKVTAATQKSENALLLSQDSVYYDDGRAYVYLAVDGRAQKTFVETGISNPELVEVVSGISSTDIVITSWHPNLIDGAMIALAS